MQCRRIEESQIYFAIQYKIASPGKSCKADVMEELSYSYIALLVPRPSHTHQNKNYSALLLVTSVPLLFSLSGPPYRPIAIAGPCHAINLRHRATVSKFFRLDALSPAAVSLYTDGTEHYMRRYISRATFIFS